MVGNSAIDAHLRAHSYVLREQDAFDFLTSLPDSCADLVLTSPPYCMGKEYESSTSAADFKREYQRIAREVTRVVKPGGSICWQVGYHVTNNVVVPLDSLIYSDSLDDPDLRLRSRIIWTFGHGFHATKRFSGRHETILWFTKGNEYYFDLDSVRVPQKYPGKKAYKGDRKGQWSGNPLGKNPSDVWDIPNVKARHVEKTDHPCQFPVALAQRLIRALTPRGGVVVDPYAGSASTGVAALLERRKFIGTDIEPRYLTIAKSRLADAVAGTVLTRADAPAAAPDLRQKVAQRPAHFVVEEIDG